MIELEPAPAEIAGLLVAMTEVEWPTTELDRRQFFRRFGLRDLGAPAPDRDLDDTTSARFATSLPGEVGGSFMMFRGEFLGLWLFCYDEQLENGQQARAGYTALRFELSRALGVPREEWGTVADPACDWQAGPLALDLYRFQRGRSGLMVGLDHAARSAANDAAHEARSSGQLEEG